MTLNEAIRKRINELVEEKETSLTNLCLNSNLTPSTIFEFMYNKTKSPTAITIKKICYGAGITLAEFYKPDYFNDFDDVVK
ncbi:MAG: transcriptional regulator [Clostridia bacterium]|nr:transcriptional regulator [Clostridia bacterium]